VGGRQPDQANPILRCLKLAIQDFAERTSDGAIQSEHPTKGIPQIQSFGCLFVGLFVFLCFQERG
jgi:hypothetical protein